MKKLLLVIILMTPQIIFSQRPIFAKVEVGLDSAEIVRKCNCERSAIRFKDYDFRMYHVFYDRDRDEFFRIKREKGTFTKEKLSMEGLD